ncbi:Hypothetical protein Cul131001_1877 [Corynebacterium ulcerans]|nr:Hypothetical protein Cul131001_1877 [Corynebacterium ulcerans]
MKDSVAGAILFSAYAEVVPRAFSSSISARTFLRVCGGSSRILARELILKLFSPRMRR